MTKPAKKRAKATPGGVVHTELAHKRREELQRWPSRLLELQRWARRAFKDRNAAGAPDRHRVRVKQDMRPHLQAAIGFIRQAAAALAEGRQSHYRELRAMAGWCMAEAQVAFRQPYMEVAAKQFSREGKAKGGRPAKVDLHAHWAQEFERMKRSAMRLTSQEIYEDIASSHGVAWRTVRDAVAEQRKKRT